VLVDVRTRKSRHGGASVPVVETPVEKNKEPLQERKTEVKTEQKAEQAGKEVPREVPKKSRKREISLYRKMFGSRKR
jgi:hypothetical protein